VRIFVAADPQVADVSYPGEIRCVETAPGVDEAYDLMVADQVPPQRAADMAMAAARSGRDPVAFAQHFIELRKAIRPA
jgi:hypothetical protein